MEDYGFYETMMHFNRFYIRFLSDMDKSAAVEGLSPVGARCLMALALHGKSTLVELNERFGTDLAYLSRQVKLLEKQGYVEKLPNKSDGRSFHIRLTEKGSAILPLIKNSIKRFVDESLSGIDDMKRCELTDSMIKIESIIDYKSRGSD